MGKATGFMEIERKTIANRPPLERVKDWDEIHEHFDEEKVQKQGARCMDCGTPYCHTGITLANMASGCPVNNLYPSSMISFAKAMAGRLRAPYEDE